MTWSTLSGPSLSLAELCPMERANTLPLQQVTKPQGEAAWFAATTSSSLHTGNDSAEERVEKQGRCKTRQRESARVCVNERERTI